MDKLTLSDVKIKSPGKQLKELAEAEFGNIENFAQVVEMKINTVVQYLKETSLGSDTFKFRVSNVFDKSLDQLIKSNEEQIKNMVNCVYDNIKAYKTDEDLNILKKIQELCTKNRLRLDNVKMQRNFAMAYFYRNEIDKAIGFMEAAISAVKTHNELIKWKSELGLMYFYQCEYKKSEKLFREIDELLNTSEEVDEKTMFLHYYRYGLLKNNTNGHALATKLFEKSLNYAKTSVEMGRATMNIGISYNRQRKYKKAIEYYNKALDIFEDKLNLSALFNNFANVYRSLGNYDKALYYVNLAFDCIDEENLSYSLVYYETYTEILMNKGEIGKAIEELANLTRMIKMAEDKFVFKKFIIDCINTIIEYGKIDNNINILEKMEKIIYTLIKNNNLNNKEYISDLTHILGNIRIYIIDIQNKLP